MLAHRHIAAHMGMTAMSGGAILLVRTGLFLRRVAPQIDAGTENLNARQQKYGQRADHLDLPAEKHHRRIGSPMHEALSIRI